MADMNRCWQSWLAVVLVFLSVRAGFAAGAAGGAASRPATSANNERLRAALQRFPEADADKDGILTLEEAAAYAAQKGRTPPRLEAAARQPAAPITYANVKYGPHERHVLDFWQAPGEGPRPLHVFIHGGGFEGGDKSHFHQSPLLRPLLEKGVSCAAINYRFREQAPLQDILRDTARAVQFLRRQAGEWRLDKNRVTAQGGSAGAGSALWLCARDDLADPGNADPVLRESSRVRAAVLQNTQATYDFARWESFLGPARPEWLKNPLEMAAIYHLKTLDDLQTPEGKKIRRECDMLAWLSQDDGPLLVHNAQPDGEIKNRGHYLHHPKHAREIKKTCDAVGVRCTLLEGRAAQANEAILQFLLDNLEVK